MASAASDLLAHFKLEAEIFPTYTSHISYRNDHARGRRKEKVEKRWYKDKVLGHGSFGEVCLEVCRQGDNIVDTRAVKKIEKAKMRSWEVLALAKFSKLQDKEEDVLVKFIGYFENADAVFLAMEYFSYGDLAQYLESPLSEPEIKQITRDIVEGLRIMHAEGFAHRDLKPNNIFVIRKFPEPWWVKIGDFGMAKRDGEQTDLRTWGGTPHYQAPEFNGYVEELEETSIHTNAVDMWSLGCVVYSLASKGAVPFPTPSAVNRFCNGKLPFPDKALSMTLTSSGIQFVKDLLVRLPSERLTAETAQHAPWLRKGHESFQSPSHPTAVIQQQSGVAKLPRPAPIDRMATNSTQDAAPFLLPKHPKTFATGGNSTARPSKDQKLDQLRVEPTNVSSESSDAWRRSPKSYHAMEENLIGKDNEKERSEEGGEERDGDTVFELPTHSTRDHERLSITPLHRTVLPPISTSLQKAQRREATRLLRDAGFDFNAPNYSPKSAWFWAAKHGYKAVTLLLLEKGADIEVKDNDGRTALHHAASNGHEAVARLFLEKGVDIEGKDNDGRTALHLAAFEGHEAVARLFLKKGAGLEVKNNNGGIALHDAAFNGHEAVAHLFLEKGASLEVKNNSGGTALHVAARKGHEAVAHLFLEEGADIEVKNKIGRTALHLAASNGHEAVARLFLEKGADIEVKRNDGSTALHEAASNGHEAVARLFLEKGADIEVKNQGGATALHIAAYNGHEAVARLFLEKGAGLEVKDNDGWTALHVAARNDHEAVARLFLEKEADIEVKDNDGRAALHIAACNGHEAVARLFLEKGAGLEVKAHDGWTALHFAASNGHEAVICLLLDKGADIRARNSRGSTAAKLAAKGGHESCAKLLKSRLPGRWSIFRS